MDILSLISGGSENLYKYLFLGGILLVFVALWYPTGKEFEFRKVENEYKRKLKLSNYELIKMAGQIQEFKRNDSQRGGKNMTGELQKLVSRYNELMKDTIEISYYRELVEIQKKQVSWYGNLFWFCLIPGLFLVVIGAGKWHQLMKIIHQSPRNNPVTRQ